VSAGADTYKRAARVGHPIAHLSTRGGIFGGLAGVALGAAVVVGVGVGAILVVGTGGLAAAGIGGIVVAGVTSLKAGGVLTVMGLTVAFGRSQGEAMRPTSIQGHITAGSPTVFLGSPPRRAARANPNDPKTSVDCHEGHFVVQGSKTVFIDLWPASRVDDGTSCIGKIADGEAKVYIGGERYTLPGYRDLGEERRPFMYRFVFFLLELAGQVERAPWKHGLNAAQWLLWSGEFLPFLYSQTSLPYAATVGAMGGWYGARRSSIKAAEERLEGMTRAREIGVRVDLNAERIKVTGDSVEALRPDPPPAGSGSPSR
jgi:uncharacterized Zn-binding protein involved in type VI secretion